MFGKTKVKSTVLLSVEQLKNEYHCYLKGVELAVVWDADCFAKKTSEINVTSKAKIRLFFEDDFMYISDFDEDMAVLDVPVDAILIKKKQVVIYVGFNRMVMNRCNLHEYALEETFYTKDAKRQEPPSKKKRCTEADISTSEEFYGSEYSEDIGETFNTSVYSDEDLTHRHLESSSIYGEDGGEDLAADVPKLAFKPIKQTKQDSKLAKTIRLEECQKAVKELLGKSHVSSVVRMIAVSQLNATPCDGEDLVFKSFVNSIKSTGLVPESDPVTVVQQNDKYLVLSGSKRVNACAAEGLSQMAVHSVDPGDANKFLVRKFFMENNRADPGVLATMDCIKTILKCIDVSDLEFSSWKDVEQAKVFGNYINFETKIGIVLKICSKLELAEQIKDLCTRGIDLTSRSLLSVHSKYKSNPTETIGVLQKYMGIQFTDKKFRADLKMIQPDISTLLSKKIADNAVVQRLVANFSSDIHFETFIRSSDIRKRGGDHYGYVVKRFENYKSDKQLSESRSLTISSTVANSDTDLYLTYEESEGLEWLSKSDGSLKSRILIVFGKAVPQASVHSIILPDELSFVDENKKISNRITISVIVRKAQQLLESEMFSFFYEECKQYRETYLLSEIKPMIQRRAVCFLNLLHHKKLAADVTEHIKTIQASCDMMAKEVLNSKKHSQRKSVRVDDQYS